MNSSDNESWYTTLYIMAMAVCIWAVMWNLKVGRVGYWAMVAGLLGSLCYWGFPGYYGLLLICCSLWLFNVALGTRVEFVPMHGRAVLITGCDTGFGHALAMQLSDMGVTVFAGVLQENSPGAQELRQRAPRELHVLQLNVTDRLQIEQAHQYIHSQVGGAGLWGLVNNAGHLGCVMDGEIQPRTAYRRCLDVNYLAAVDMCQVFLPMLRRSKGRIVNVCSMAGEVPLLGFAPYAASKAALISFSKVIRLELAGWGVKVATIQPSAFRTNIFGTSKDWSRYQEEILDHLSPGVREDYGEAYISSMQYCFTKMADQSSEDLCPVLKDMCHALMSKAPKALYTPGRLAWLIPFLYRCLPTAVTEALIPHIFKFSDSLPAGMN